MYGVKKGEVKKETRRLYEIMDRRLLQVQEQRAKEEGQRLSLFAL